MNFGKMMKKLDKSHIVMIVAALALGYAFFNYSSTKSLLTDNMEGSNSNNASASTASAPTVAHASNGAPQPSAPIGENSQPAKVSGINTTTPTAQSFTQGVTINPAELLPKDQNNEWSKLNPTGTKDLQGINLLSAGHHIGQSVSSLRNANLQLRSEPANPVMQPGACPWNQSTIQPDTTRRPLEIGE